MYTLYKAYKKLKSNLPLLNLLILAVILLVVIFPRKEKTTDVKISITITTTTPAQCITYTDEVVEEVSEKIEEHPVKIEAKNSIVEKTPSPNTEEKNKEKKSISEHPIMVALRHFQTYNQYTTSLKIWENDDLALGSIQISTIHKDKLNSAVQGEVGYGVTEGEIADAISVGVLPKGSSTPTSLTKAEADKWMDTVTIPTYLKIVELEVKVPLTTKQKGALTCFCQNLGRGNLRSLINTEGGLNSGNYTKIPEQMKEYCHAQGVKIAGLVTRRAKEAEWFAEGTTEAIKKQQLLAQSK